MDYVQSLFFKVTWNSWIEYMMHYQNTSTSRIDTLLLISIHLWTTGAYIFRLPVKYARCNSNNIFKIHIFPCIKSRSLTTSFKIQNTYEISKKCNNSQAFLWERLSQFVSFVELFVQIIQWSGKHCQAHIHWYFLESSILTRLLVWRDNK